MGTRYRDDGPRGGERWDRERFDRGPIVERDIYEERDYYAPRPQRTSPRRYEQKERVIYEERDRYEAPYRPRRYDYEETERDRFAGAMVHRPRREQEDIEIEIRRREYERDREPRDFQRPAFVRRQSSLDTFDRKPMPRYGDVARVREETVMIPAPRRRQSPRYREPPRFEEYEEEIQVSLMNAVQNRTGTIKPAAAGNWPFRHRHRRETPPPVGIGRLARGMYPSVG